MPQNALIAIAGGLMSAMASMAFLGGSALALIFVYLAPVPILLVGLGRGAKAATLATGTGILATGAFGGVTLAGIYGLVYALPAWMIARIVMQQQTMQQPPAAFREPRQANEMDTGEPVDVGWNNVGTALTTLALMATGFILFAHFNAGDQGLKEMLGAKLGEAFEAMVPMAGNTGSNRMIDVVLPIFPGTVGTSWVLMTVLNAVFAQKLLVRLGQNIRPSPAYAELVLPQWASWPLVLSAGAALTGPLLGMEDLGYIGRNTAMVMALPYFFLGLAVIHTLARQVTATGPILFAVYLVVLISGWAALVVAGVGIVEQWIGLRDRSGNLNAGKDAGEDE